MGAFALLQYLFGIIAVSLSLSSPLIFVSPAEQMRDIGVTISGGGGGVVNNPG